MKTCKGKTKLGQSCSRTVKHGGYCFQHKKLGGDGQVSKIELPFLAYFRTTEEFVLNSADPSLNVGDQILDASSTQENTVLSNMDSVSRCALSIDQLLGQILAKWFEPRIELMRKPFKQWLIYSSYLSFNSRYSIFIAALESQGKIDLLKTTKKNFHTHFIRIRNFRNAFAHGDLIRDAATNAYKIEFFSGSPQSHTLDQARFEKIADSCRTVFGVLREINFGAWEIVPEDSTESSHIGR